MFNICSAGGGPVVAGWRQPQQVDDRVGVFWVGWVEGGNTTLRSKVKPRFAHKEQKVVRFTVCVGVGGGVP